MNKIPNDTIQTDMEIKPDGPIILIVPGNMPRVDQRLDQGTDVKYQEIFYAKGRIKDRGPDTPDKMVPIDLAKALDETMNLSLASTSDDDQTTCAWINFYNQKIGDSIDILRVSEDLWNLSTPVFAMDERYCFKYIAQSNTKRLTDIIKMFFNGDDWYGMINFVFDEQMFEAEREM